MFFSHFAADLPHGPRSIDPFSSQMAWRAAILSGGFRLNFFITFLPYREMEGRRRRDEEIKTNTDSPWGSPCLGAGTYTGELAGRIRCRQLPMWAITSSTSSTELSRRFHGPRSYSNTSCRGRHTQHYNMESQSAAEGITAGCDVFKIRFQWNRSNRWEVGVKQTEIQVHTLGGFCLCVCVLPKLLCTSLSNKSIFIILLILPDMLVVLKHGSGFVVVVLCV